MRLKAQFSIGLHTAPASGVTVAIRSFRRKNKRFVNIDRGG